MTLVLLPGLNNTSAVWTPVVNKLVAFGVDAASISAVECCALPSVEAIAKELLRTLPTKFYLGGFSFGGYVALAIQALAPERVAGLILVNTSANSDNEKTVDFRRQAIADAQAGRHESMMLKQMPILFDKASLEDDALQASLLDMLREYGVEAFVAHTLACISRPDRRSALSDLNVPTLVVSGAQDRLIPPAVQEKMAREISGATYQTIEKSGHMLPIERPAELAACMFRWLEAQKFGV
ncbi:MAG: alpha/beta hydrolase [SAR86 cluster bacterium]|jgi:pimeloyl-ACP methyl ester carboxylesterase|uniref:Alpha/beta hydrolase n=1 Tax=SAR86 cluster bacterium TaxID=2030880 RepID=A0A973A9N2_9GAMM|nr:alpha/beta hydrolase [SAR86 cluster bacterium]